MTYTFRHLPELRLCSAINAVDRLNSRKMCMHHSSVHTWIWYSNVDMYHIGKLRGKTLANIYSNRKKYLWFINHGICY